MSDLPSKWSYWMTQYLGTHCTARGLALGTIRVYQDRLKRFRGWMEEHRPGVGPDGVATRDVLEYVEHLRRGGSHGDSAINLIVTVLRSFYQAMVSLRQLEPRDNPLAHFPKVKKPARKLPVTLNEEEVLRLLVQPRMDTIIGLRDRALLAVLYGTGIRASEASGLDQKHVDLERRTLHVVCGKGGNDRIIPLNETTARALSTYILARGPHASGALFVSRKGRRMSRNAIYEQVRAHTRRSGIQKSVSPHRLRHAFATHLVRAGVNLVTIRDLLGHRQITSTQIYLHMTAHDLREAADRHPISALAAMVQDILPDVKLKFQKPPVRRSG